MFENVKAVIAQTKEKLATVDWHELMQQTFKVCRWFNIELTKAFDMTTTIHWSVVLVLLVLLLNNPLTAGLFALALISVVPHEYGHALMARYYKLKTRKILIYPVGGVALIEPNKEVDMVRGKELIVAAAGPLVSFALAAIGFLGVWLSGDNHVNIMQHPDGSHFIYQGYNLSGFWFWLGAINLGMVIFNLIPAFPMDGGRIFRASLSFWLGELKATKIAYYVSVGLCYFLALIGLMTLNLSLIFIPLIVMWMAKMELRRVELLESSRKF